MLDLPQTTHSQTSCASNDPPRQKETTRPSSLSSEPGKLATKSRNSSPLLSDPGWDVADSTDHYLNDEPSIVPELRLVAAIVARALMDAFGRLTNRGQTTRVVEYEILQKQARAWLRKNESDDWSFVWCIEQLFDDSESAIRALRKLIDEGATDEQQERIAAHVKKRSKKFARTDSILYALVPGCARRLTLLDNLADARTPYSSPTKEASKDR